MGLQRVRHDGSDWAHTQMCMHAYMYKLVKPTQEIQIRYVDGLSVNILTVILCYSLQETIPLKKLDKEYTISCLLVTAFFESTMISK